MSTAAPKSSNKATKGSSINSFEIPEGNATKEELVETFSISRNDYFKCKWNKFLADVPRQTLKIKPYEEFIKKKPPVRRKILSGSFYKPSGELLPVPEF